ncbi:hypothetical protein G5714_016564 [Onychostoma macrolepis]|uniref:Uncharacterized protein n=1 Tax=Onychostoma macrolepis TaxID=369639 RepID=A0A7J6C9F5_9TELE|nr:hypothetical protein G5714_016564 [Onychostoma macrolepis]
MKEAMAHLPSPEEAGDKFSTELFTFCQEFSPTVHELGRLMAVKLGASSWHKVSERLQKEDSRREHSKWEHRHNLEYRTAVEELAEGIKVAFPACVDTAKIGNCCQNREESIQDYYHRLYEIFNKHSGLIEPDDQGNQPETWECHLRTWFLNGLRPEIAQAVKTSYIEWKNGRLSAVLAHALHAEELQTAKKEKAKARTDRELQLALVQAVSRPGGSSVQRRQQTGGEEEKGKVEDARTGLKEILRNGVVGSVKLMIMRPENAPNVDCARKMVIGPRTAQRTSKIKKQTEHFLVFNADSLKHGCVWRSVEELLSVLGSTLQHRHLC